MKAVPSLSESYAGMRVTLCVRVMDSGPTLYPTEMLAGWHSQKATWTSLVHWARISNTAPLSSHFHVAFPLRTDLSVKWRRLQRDEHYEDATGPWPAPLNFSTLQELLKKSAKTCQDLQRDATIQSC